MGSFLNLINLIIIFCYNKIVKGNSFEDFKNLRYLQTTTTDLLPSEYSSTDLTPIDNETSYLAPSDSTNSTNDDTEEVNPLFIGVDHYNYNDGILSFWAYFFTDNKADYPENIILNVKKKRILRMLQEDSITCLKKDDSGNIGVYNCTYIYNESIDTLTISYPGNNQTDYAKYTLTNIKDQVGQIISSGEFFFIKDCSIPDMSKNVIIGKPENNIDNNAGGVIYITNSTGKEEIPVTFTKEDASGTYNIKLNLKESFTKNLNNTVGTLNNKNTTYILLFNQDGNSTMDYDYNPTKNKAFFPKKSSSGLSAGAIVAIILPCIAALLAVVGLAFFLGKSSSSAAASTIPMEQINMGNNTIGISSSSNVVNK